MTALNFHFIHSQVNKKQNDFLHSYLNGAMYSKANNL